MEYFTKNYAMFCGVFGVYVEKKVRGGECTRATGKICNCSFLVRCLLCVLSFARKIKENKLRGHFRGVNGSNEQQIVGWERVGWDVSCNADTFLCDFK